MSRFEKYPISNLRDLCGNGKQIYELSAADGSDVSGGPLTSSHYDGELRGLARHPTKAEFVTAGGDGTVSSGVQSTVSRGTLFT